jgi:hypothetical protein
VSWTNWRRRSSGRSQTSQSHNADAWLFAGVELFSSSRGPNAWTQSDDMIGRTQSYLQAYARLLLLHVP